MAVNVVDFSELDLEQVQALQTQQSELLQAWNPQLHVRSGPIHDLNVYAQAIAWAVFRTEMDRLRRSSSLLTASQDPELAEEEILDAIAANFLIERRTGARAEGVVVVTVSELLPITVGIGSRFEAQGLGFVVPQTVYVRTNAGSVESDADVVLTSNGDGTYSFRISVIAESPGAEYQLRRGVSLQPVPSLDYFVVARAADNFEGGQNTETNADLIARLRAGPTVRASSGRMHLVAAAAAPESVIRPLHSSIIGFGDPEMQRDHGSLWPGSLGGRADWYCRTAERLSSLTAVRTATLVEKTANGGIWQFSVGRDELPGFYEVTQVYPVTTDDEEPVQGLEVVLDLRSADMAAISGLDVLPDISNSRDAVYSRFQAAVIRVLDPVTSTVGLTEYVSEQDYSTTLVGLPAIADLQLQMGRREFRHVGGDLLIKAPVPCFLGVTLSLTYSDPNVLDGLDAVRTAMARTVNTYGFVGSLPASLLIDSVHNVLGTEVAVTELDMLGRVVYPEGQTYWLRDRDSLVIPDNPADLVTGRTVAFFLDPADISILPIYRQAVTY